MTTVAAQALTYADWAKRTDPEGNTAEVVELLNQTNEVMDDMLVVEGNLPTGHRTTVRTGLPKAAWRLLNYGVPKGKSRTAQVDDACGMLEAYSEIDKALADLNGNTAEFRLSEDRAYIEGVSQQMAQCVFYGNAKANAAEFTGLSERFNTVDTAKAENAVNVLDAGGTGSTNTSIWLVVWGANTVHGIFPKGTKAGLQVNDKGQQTIQDGAGGQFEAYRSHYKWDNGISVRDWRYVVRICNVDVTALKKDAASGADLVDLITQALELVPNLQMGKAAIYCNKTIRSYLRRQIKNAKNINLTLEEVAGKKVVAFDGVPVRRTDVLLNTEARVV